MFHEITPLVKKRMQELEAMDAQDRREEKPRLERMRQIPRETGEFLALMAAMAPEGKYIEIGTSGGYSTLWIALACRQLGRRITTYELLDRKFQIAKETFQSTEMTEVVEQVQGDARVFLSDLSDISFCFLDAEKDLYYECYDLVVPRMKSGGILIADNAIDHRETLEPMLQHALSDSRVDAMIVNIQNGELLCRKK